MAKIDMAKMGDNLIATAGRLAYREQNFECIWAIPSKPEGFHGAHRTRNMHFALPSMHAQRCTGISKSEKN